MSRQNHTRITLNELVPYTTTFILYEMEKEGKKWWNGGRGGGKGDVN